MEVWCLHSGLLLFLFKGMTNNQNYIWVHKAPFFFSTYFFEY